ncbi:MAG: DUF3137 domain-containing protein [Tepidisphaeraceae bacterium]
MSTLDYQNSDDARHERKGFLRQLFGASQQEVWAALAQEIDARYEQGGWFTGGRLIADVGPWQVTLDVVNRDKHCFTRLRAPFVNPDGFRFRVHRRNIFTGLGEALGMQDIKIGVEPFDHDFIVKSADEAKVRTLLSNERLRRLIDFQPHIHFAVKDDEGWFGTKFPEGVDELYFERYGILKDPELLKGLFNLFAETLQQLCIQGSAYETPPGVTL